MKEYYDVIYNISDRMAGGIDFSNIPSSKLQTNNYNQNGDIEINTKNILFKALLMLESIMRYTSMVLY